MVINISTASSEPVVMSNDYHCRLLPRRAKTIDEGRSRTGGDELSIVVKGKQGSVSKCKGNLGGGRALPRLL